MNHNFKENIEKNQYFQSLPPFVQETILQSGIKIGSESDLKKFEQKLIKGK